MLWPIFRCEKPDFIVRSIPDKVVFPVSRNALLTGSDVFRRCLLVFFSCQHSKGFLLGDMFACCDASLSADEPQVLDLDETESILNTLLHLLHSTLHPPVRNPRDSWQEKVNTKLPKPKYEPATVIPMPLLPVLFSLADKYTLSDDITDALHIHLLAHAPMDPLKVYGLATLYERPDVAARASQYLLPMAWYASQDIKIIPSAVAYHDLARLQNFRVKCLREILLHQDADLFPHGQLMYCQCRPHIDFGPYSRIWLMPFSPT